MVVPDVGLLTSDPTFTESDDVVLDLVGDPDQAHFVQVMKGHGSDPENAPASSWASISDEWAAFRPDVLGSVVAMDEGGDYTMAIYFTTEAEARAGEAEAAAAGDQGGNGRDDSLMLRARPSSST